MSMNDMDSHHAMNAIAHWSEMAGQAAIQAAAQYERPSALYKPKLSVDGNQWCALYGDNLQDGVAGFGDSPEDAMWNFDKAWRASLKEPKP